MLVLDVFSNLEVGHAMGHVSLEGLQKILKLDVEYPYFITDQEDLEFVIDGSLVKAIATISWRRIATVGNNRSVHGTRFFQNPDSDQISWGLLCFFRRLAK